MRKTQQAFIVSTGFLFVLGCGGPPCRTPTDCEVGFYCAFKANSSFGAPSGECTQDCAGPDDCPLPDSNITRAICTNEGRCRIEPRPPRLAVFEPELEQVYEEGTRRIRVTGEVESAAEQVTVRAAASPGGECYGGPARAVTVNNPTPGEFATVPFVIDGVVIDTGMNSIKVTASVQGSKRETSIEVGVECPGCATLSLATPTLGSSVPGLVLPFLQGRVSPSVSAAVWRVHSLTGDIFDGTMPVIDGVYSAEGIPLFPGFNRIEVVVSGVGDGLGEARCSVPIASSVSLERGLRTVLNWDGPTSDLDVHLLGPQGVFGDPLTTLSTRSRSPQSFSGTVLDDFSGFGPEIIQISMMPDGVYGVIVEPVFDGDDPGATALMRVLFDGRFITPTPVGPRHLSADRGQLWVLGTVTVSQESIEWRLIDEVVDAWMPPTTTPTDWPDFYAPQ